MQFPRTTQLSPTLQPSQTPLTPSTQHASKTPTAVPINTIVGNGASHDSLQSDRQSFAMTILQTQAASLYPSMLGEATYTAISPPLPPLELMREVLQKLTPLDHVSKLPSAIGSLVGAFSNYFPVTEAIMETTENLVSMQEAFSLDRDGAEQASLLLKYHNICQNIAWEMFQASLHYSFQAHRLCNLSEDAAAAELGMPMAYEHQENGMPPHHLLVERQQLGIKLSAMALNLMAEHQYFSEILCSGLKVYSRLSALPLYQSAFHHSLALRDLEVQLQACAATPASDFVSRVFDAADHNMSSVSSALANLANDRLSAYLIDAVADGQRITSYLAQRYTLWQGISSEQIPQSINETRSRILNLEHEMSVNVSKAIESFQLQMSYFFESKLNMASCTDRHAEKDLLESYAYLSELQFQRRDAIAATARLFMPKPDITVFSSRSAGPGN